LLSLGGNLRNPKAFLYVRIAVKSQTFLDLFQENKYTFINLNPGVNKMSKKLILFISVLALGFFLSLTISVAGRFSQPEAEFFSEEAASFDFGNTFPMDNPVISWVYDDYGDSYPTPEEISHAGEMTLSITDPVNGSVLEAGGSSSVWFVDADAPPGGDGTSWESAFTVIHDAMDAASSGDMVKVAEGIYYENIQMRDGVKILGGWNSTFAERDPQTYISS
jgi:hypothetical protein